jgi:hypothetical protein
MSFSCERIAQVAACLMAAAVAAPGSAAAFGAIAVGEPANIAKRGVALGLSYSYSIKEEAEASALKYCLNFKDAPADTRALCKLVKTFDKQCAAVALDPKNGTPGFGWAVMTNKAEAEKSAMDRCRETAGASRIKFCKLTNSECDNPKSPSPPQSN